MEDPLTLEQALKIVVEKNRFKLSVLAEKGGYRSGFSGFNN